MKFRPPTWESDLAAALAEAEKKPFAWWHHDCVTAACRLAGAAMGRDLLAFVRKPWNERRAAEMLETFGGVDGWLNVVARMAYLETVDPRRANRGALVTLRAESGDLHAGCLVGTHVAVVAREGLRLRPRAQVEAAWTDA